MKSVSNKQQRINRKLKKVYELISKEREHCCSGCGRYDLPLSHSHLIPRSRRKDLECEGRNIVYHCLSIGERQGCHQLWESNLNDKMRLLDYHKNMNYIRSADSGYYYLLINKD